MVECHTKLGLIFPDNMKIKSILGRRNLFEIILISLNFICFLRESGIGLILGFDFCRKALLRCPSLASPQPPVRVERAVVGCCIQTTHVCWSGHPCLPHSPWTKTVNRAMKPLKRRHAEAVASADFSPPRPRPPRPSTVWRQAALHGTAEDVPRP